MRLRIAMTNPLMGTLLLLSTVLLTACSSPPDYPKLNKDARKAYRYADSLIQEGKHDEGVKLLLPLKRLHPGGEKIRNLIDELPEERQRDLMQESVMGFNQTDRVPVDRGVLEHVLLYLPDRILDLLEIVSVEVNVGIQAGAGAWVTRAAQANAFAGTTFGIGWMQKRQLGGLTEGVAELVIGPVGGTALAGVRAGTGGIDSTTRDLSFHTPKRTIYQEYRDYWSVGGKVGLAVAGAKAEVHLLEIADFFTGLATIDLLRDDYAATRGLDFSPREEELYKRLLKTIGRLSIDQRAKYQRLYPTLFHESESSETEGATEQEK